VAGWAGLHRGFGPKKSLKGKYDALAFTAKCGFRLDFEPHRRTIVTSLASRPFQTLRKKKLDERASMSEMWKREVYTPGL
jgi:hypothetical protein